MVKVYKLDDCPLSERAGTYGGQAGFKDGIVWNNENWLVKYPKTMSDMRAPDMSYTTSPLSEYIGSKIYQALGYDTHEVQLGYRNDKIVVACKDFCENEGALREVRTIKNLANPKLAKMLDQSFHSTGLSHFVDLEETLLHIKHNDILSKIPGIEERFWDCVIVDVLINNNDRNNGNWGILYQQGKYTLAPIYDNGAAFAGKSSDRQLAKILANEDRIKQSIMSSATGYQYQKKQIFAKDIFQLPFDGLKEALKRNIPLIIQNAEKINKIFRDTPTRYEQQYICSDIRKQFYTQSMNCRMEQLLIPAYNKCVQKEQEINSETGKNLFQNENRIPERYYGLYDNFTNSNEKEIKNIMQQISEEKNVHFDKIVYDVVQNTICTNNEIVGHFDKKMRYIEGIPEFSFEETLEHAQKETNIINQQKEKQMISKWYHER